MDEAKVYEAYHELPDGFEVQVMVLQDYPGGRQRRGLTPSIYRARVWIGVAEEPDPLLHRSQEHPALQAASAVRIAFGLIFGSYPASAGRSTHSLCAGFG